MGVLIVFIGVFFGATGFFAIMQSLMSLGKEKSDSSIETSLFKMNAPAGFIYGIMAIGIVVFLIKFHNYGDQTNRIETLEKELSEKKNGNPYYKDSINLIQIEMTSQKPASIFGGKILLNYQKRNITFSGINGVSKNLDHQFNGNSIEIKKGMKFYFMTKDSIIWGVNVIEAFHNVELEIYKE